MVANICLLALYLIRWAFGSFAALLVEHNPFNYDDVQKRFFVEPNFNKLMECLTKLSDLAFAKRGALRFLRINLLLWFFFSVALIWYSIKITGLRSLVGFFERGLTINLSDDERNYLLYYWPWHYLDLSRNSGHGPTSVISTLKALS
jgi:hypothetical protein